MLFHAIGGDAHHGCHFLVGALVHVALLQHKLGLGGQGMDDLIDFVQPFVKVVEIVVVFLGECRLAILGVLVHALLFAEVVHALITDTNIQKIG